MGSPGDIIVPYKNSLSRGLPPVFALLSLLCFSVFLNAQSPALPAPSNKPADAPQEWKHWIGDYGKRDNPLFVLERDSKLWIAGKDFGEREFKPEGAGNFKASAGAAYGFTLFASGGVVKEVRGDTAHNLPKLDYRFSIQPGSSSTPAQTVENLRKLALAANPPEETGDFRKPALVELATLDPAIHLDIRYATTNDFLGVPVYTQARAFLQRPAAEALLRALQTLKPLGYGLLIHDAYRPWYVTKIFWEATPPEGKIFVADPSQGSRHNRGCAVDLTLYDLATGKPIEMPGTYDEMSPRSFPDYPGGTSLQRWHRDLLRRAMESEGFTVYEHEWWHFDYKDWHEYPILNIKFEDLHSGQGLAIAQ